MRDTIISSTSLILVEKEKKSTEENVVKKKVEFKISTNFKKKICFRERRDLIFCIIKKVH